MIEVTVVIQVVEDEHRLLGASRGEVIVPPAMLGVGGSEGRDEGAVIRVAVEALKRLTEDGMASVIQQSEDYISLAAKLQ